MDAYSRRDDFGVRGSRLIRALVLGSTGQLGSELTIQLRSSGAQVIEANRHSANHAFDLAKPDSIAHLIQRSRPDVVFHAAASGSVAWCEANPRVARRMTVNAAGEGAIASAAVNARFVFFSTDYVFDGKDAPSSERVVPAPLNIYGQQKLEAERLVSQAAPQSLVVRTCQLFGLDPHRKNFVYQVYDALRSGDSISAAADLFGTPTWTADLVRITLTLLDAGKRGVWHVGGEEFVSRYDLGKRVARAFNLDPLLVMATSAASLNDGVRRPSRAGLRNERLDQEGGMRMTSLDEALIRVATAEAAG